jgi:hypothetical protein
MLYILWLSLKKDLWSINKAFFCVILLVCILRGRNADDQLLSPTALVGITASYLVTNLHPTDTRDMWNSGVQFCHVNQKVPSISTTGIDSKDFWCRYPLNNLVPLADACYKRYTTFL